MPLNKLRSVLIALSLSLLIAACANVEAVPVNGGAGGVGGIGGGGSGGGGTSTPADRFVVSGNLDGTLSLLRVNPVAGFATALAFTKVSAFAFSDLYYDESNERLIAIDSRTLYVIRLDPATGIPSVLDSVTSSTTSNSHLVVSSDGSRVYVATGSGVSGFIDGYTIDGAGRLTALAPVATSVDPDYMQLNPDGDRLYLVSQSSDTIDIYEISSDGALSGSPSTFATDQNPRALLFNPSADVAYLLRQDSSGNSLQVLDVDPSTGALSNSDSFFDAGDSPIDLVLSRDSLDLYVIDSNNSQITHYDVSTSGTLAFGASENLSFTPTDLALSHTGAELYVSHSEEDLVSTLAVSSSDGSVTVVNWTRVFDAAQTVAAIGGNGALTQTATFVLAPDQSGLSRFSVDGTGALDLDATLTNTEALIGGDSAVDYGNGLLFTSGQDSANQDVVASYAFDPLTGATTLVDDFIGSFDENANFERVETGRSGRFFYVLDAGNFSAIPQAFGAVRAYAYSATGDVTPTPVDTESIGLGAENMTMHPAGRFLYSINSFGDTVQWDEVNESDGTLSGGGTTTPGRSGSGVGRPLDLVVHPNGRFAYVSLEDDSEVVRYIVDDDGSLDNLSRFNTATSNGGSDTQPGPLAMHPTGLFLFAGERDTDTNILVMEIDPSASYSLSFSDRLATTGNPTWIAINTAGDRLYVRYADENIEVFSFDPVSGTVTSTGQTVSAGTSGSFLGTLTVVEPLQ